MERNGLTKKRSFTFFLFVLCSSALVGCVSHTWAPPAGKSIHDFDAQRARCSLYARNGGQGFAAVGTTSFVAGAAVGNAVGNTIKAQQDFNDCMAASGWTVADQTPEQVAASKMKADRLKDLAGQRVSCVNAARADPAFAAILSHLPDPTTNKFAISQLADLSYPSNEEAKIFAGYSDRSIACRDAFISSIATVSPALSQMMRDGSANADESAVMLVRRQLTWGEWSTRLKQANDDLATKLRSARV